MRRVRHQSGSLPPVHSRHQPLFGAEWRLTAAVERHSEPNRGWWRVTGQGDRVSAVGGAASPDRDAGYRYELSILQAELSLTQVLDRAGVLRARHPRHNLDAGRPDQVSLIVDRRLINGRRRRTLLGRSHITAGQITYDLRRPRMHGLITPIPGTHYHTTGTGLHHATLLTHAHTRLLQPGLAQLTDPHPAGYVPPPATTNTPSTSSPTKPDPPHEPQTSTRSNRLRRP
ncbi:MAG: hypothetical protein ACRDSR_02725 [Pseudonocardiaceae bacterium]